MVAGLDNLLKKYQAISSWLLILLAAIFYRGVLSCGFVFDDTEQVLQNPFVKNPHLWKQIFVGAVWSFVGRSVRTSFYRPLHTFSYWLVCRVAGFNPVAYHLFQLALYALCIWTVYRISRKVLHNELAAFAGTLLWTLHPLHVEPVAWIAAIPDIGCGLFCLLAFWRFLRAEDHAPASQRETSWGNSKFPFWVPGCGVFVDVNDVSNHAESGKLARMSSGVDFLVFSVVTVGTSFRVYPLSLKSRPS